MTHERAAQLYGSRGWLVFPISEGKKNPPLVKWSVRSSSNTRIIGNWFTRRPNANLGLACGQSNVAVIDVDTKHNKRGHITLDMFELIEGKRLSPTLMQRTPSGGVHLFYQGAIPTSQNVIGRHLWDDEISHIDTRGVGSAAGGYVLLPPSKLTGVGKYEWLNKLPLAPVDQWVIDIFTEHSGLIGHNMVAQESVVHLDLAGNVEWFRKHLEEDAPAAIEGQGGEFCTLLLAGLAKDHGISEDTALEMMFDLSSWNGRCEPSWDFDELKQKVANAYSYLAQTAPGASTPEADFKDDPPPALTPGEIESERKTVERNKRMTPASELKPIKPRYRMIDGRRTRVYREGEV